MSAPKKSNVPSNNTAGGGNGGNKQQGGMGMLIGISVVVVIVIIALVSAFSGGDKKKKEDPKVKQTLTTTQGASSGQKSAKVYDTPKREIKRVPVNAQVNTEQLQYYTDPVTNIQMVQTPSGPVPVDSMEGRKYIEDFNNLQQATNPATPNAPQQQPQIAKAELDALKQTTNDQVKALDDKINELTDQTESLKALVVKQNETIEKMAHQVKGIQPIMKSPNELAKELFGKNASTELKNRNRSIEVDSIVGEKAYVSTKNGEVALVGVGDVIPQTSLKIKKIDPSTNTVIVAD